MVCLIRKEEDPILKRRLVLVVDTLLTIQNQLPLPVYTKFIYSLDDKERKSEIDRNRFLFDKEIFSPVNMNYLALMP